MKMEHAGSEIRVTEDDRVGLRVWIGGDIEDWDYVIHAAIVAELKRRGA